VRSEQEEEVWGEGDLVRMRVIAQQETLFEFVSRLSPAPHAITQRQERVMRRVNMKQSTENVSLSASANVKFCSKGQRKDAFTSNSVPRASGKTHSHQILFQGPAERRIHIKNHTLFVILFSSFLPKHRHYFFHKVNVREDGELEMSGS
jgi:hypothetical protein